MFKPMATPDAAPRGRSAKVVSEIKNRRKKKGDVQYLVVYESDKSDRGHWVSSDELKCPGLIQQYETKAASPRPELPSAEKRKVTEILGLTSGPDEILYVVRFSYGPREKVVRRAFLHKHCSKLLLSFYESNLKFMSDITQLPPDRPGPIVRPATDAA
jgi:hypothetical protein